VRRNLWFVLLLAMMAAPVLVTACGDDDDDEGDAGGNAEDIGAVEETLTRLLEADPTVQEDVDFWLAHVTDNALESFFGTTREECAANAEDCIGESTPVEGFEGTSVTDSQATTTVTDADGTVYTTDLVLEDGAWKLDEVRFGPAQIPAGVTAIDVEMNEYAFIFDSSAIVDGNVGFPFENVGQEPHELAILKTNEEFDLQTVIDSLGDEGGDGEEEGASPSPEGEEGGSPDDELPPGVDDIFFGGFAPPGASGNAVFEEPLEPGTYMMFCSVTNEDNVTHAELGMAQEFEVPAE
jgi:hypothetical protein